MPKKITSSILYSADTVPLLYCFAYCFIFFENKKVKIKESGTGYPQILELST